MYIKYKWPTNKERKFVQLSASQRVEFANEAYKLCDKYSDITIHAIVVKKQNVQPHIRNDGNKLYNYMIKLCLIKKLASHDLVTLMPDQRSIKVKSGNSLSDYLQTELWFTEKAITTLNCQPQDSSQSLGVQFADFVSGIVQARYERNEPHAYQAIASKIKLSPLFF